LPAFGKKPTASAGVSYNKFLTNRGGDGSLTRCRLLPSRERTVVASLLPVRRFHSVSGQKGAEK
jgi:hypothetical protein